MTTDAVSTSRDRVAARVRFGVLGPLTVTEGDESLNLGGVKQRTVLAMLVAHAGKPVSIDAIIEAVWGEETPSTARRNTQTYVSTLRGVVGEVIERSSQGWRLGGDRQTIDAVVFENLFSSAAASVESNPERASVALREALALWRGHPYADVEAHGMLDGEITRLSEMRRAAQAARIDADLALGRHAELIGEIEALTVEHPYSERFRAQHMLALYRAGRQEEALRSYQRLRATLLDELGVDPTLELQDLEAKILQQDESLALAPARSVQRRAVLVADPGDPIEIGHLPAGERTHLLEAMTDSIDRALVANGGGVSFAAGATTFVVLDEAESAARIAESLVGDLAGSGVRIAIDWGDVVMGDDSVSGAPVSRAAVMAAVGHRGQVLLSSEAQQAIAAGRGRAWRYESLGAHVLHGVEDEVLLYQLLLGEGAKFPPLDLDRLPPPLPGGANRSIPGYELREPVGQGSVGALYRAFQPSVGREVLIEVIGRAESSDLDFIRNFEADAQRLSLLDHQNIAQVVDYWRQPDGAFLVYRYPRGGFLHQTPTVDIDRVIEQVGAGLTHAHSFGMVHGSLRPDRVVLDEAGNAAIIGFPIARVVPRSNPDFSAYIAPETLAGASATPATDIYALAVLANELIAGETPGDDVVDPAHPSIARAIDDDPTRRHASVADFMVEFNPGTSEAPRERYTETRSPYKGLAAFHEADARDFYGRTAVVDELISALDDSSLVALVGPSGIGKSSVVRAGLIPALRSGAIEGSESWVIADMLPGSHPFLELQKALESVAIAMPVAVTESLVAGDSASLDRLVDVLPDGSQLLLVVDQFEELFTMTAESLRRDFLSLLARTVRSKRARVVITLRADFLDGPLRYPDFGELLRRSTVLLRAPNVDEMGEAIVRPAAGVGVTVDGAVVERMVADVGDQPGGLPLLQHALATMFEERSSDLIDLHLYNEIGGVKGSLVARAESVYGSLDDDLRQVANQLFLRLVTVTGDGPPTRRRVRITELEGLGAGRVVEAFTRARLLVTDNDPETRTPTIEVAHEALLAEWPRLRGWIDATREELALSRRLNESLAEWVANDRHDSYLLTGGRLAQHVAWTQATTLALAPAEKDFLRRSREHEDALKMRSRRRRVWIMSGFGLAAAVATVFGLFALRQADEAEQAAREAEAAALASASIAALESDPELAVLLGIQSMETAPTDEGSIALGQAVQAHRTIHEFLPPAGIGEGLAAVAMSPDGLHVVFGEPLATRLGVYSMNNLETPAWTIQSNGGQFTWAAFTLDGRLVVFEEPTFEFPVPGSGPRFLRIFDIESRSEERAVEAPECAAVLPASRGAFIDLSLPVFLSQWESNGAECEGVLGATRLILFDLNSRESTEIDASWNFASNTQGGPSLSADGSRIARAQGAEGGVFDRASGDRILELGPGHSALNADGSLVLAGNNPLELWSVDEQEKIREYPGSHNIAYFSPDQSMVIAADSNGSMVLFDTFSGSELLRLRGQGNEGVALSMTNDQRLLATASVDGSYRIWDVGSVMVGDAGIPNFTVNPGPAGGPMDSSTQLLLTSNDVDTWPAFGPFVTVAFDKFTGEEVARLDGRGLAISDDGSMVGIHRWSDASTGTNPHPDRYLVGPFEVVDASSEKTLVVLHGPCEFVFTIEDGQPLTEEPGGDCSEYPHSWMDGPTSMDFSPDGRLLAASGWAGITVVWDTTSGEVVFSRRHEGLEFPSGVGKVAFSPDGDRLAVAQLADNEIYVFDTATWDEVAAVVHGTLINALTYTPDGSLLLAGDNFTHVRVIDTESWTTLEPLVGQQGNFMRDLSVSPNSRFVATAGFDGESWIWDLEERRVVRKWSTPGQPIVSVEFLDNETVAISPAESEVVVVTLNQEKQLEFARSVVSRSFRPDECTTHDIDPCPTLEETRSG